MIKSHYIFYIIILLITITDNNYFSTITNNIFLEKINSNTTLYTFNNKICILDYVTFLGNKHFQCSPYIEPVITKINVTDYLINDIYSTSITGEYISSSAISSISSSSTISYGSIIYIFLIYIFIKIIYNGGIRSLFNSTDINVKKYDPDVKNGSDYDDFNTNVTKSDNKSDTKSDNNMTIDNFVGCNNIKKDINELITQIKYHDMFTLNDCTLPKGVLLLGPPGCGKTHLVKTIIGATKINYIFTSGSDINKIYVGSGSLMINQLFTKARENKPCLIFIDEADTIIRKRAHEESSAISTEFGSSLCKLLAELDSIKTESGIIVIFATNMNEEYIDKALLRAGRVDKILHITEPTFEERKTLFKMYLDKLYDESIIDLESIGKLSNGLTGSDIKKIVNSLKINKINYHVQKTQGKIDKSKKIIKSFKYPFNLMFKRLNINVDNMMYSKKISIKVTTNEIDNEINKCIMGLERARPINAINRKLIAFHEAGHAIMAFLFKDSILPTKICISITSKTLGYTMYLDDDQNIILNSSINNLFRQVFILYSGRSAEKIFMNEITCGAEDDYIKARKILKRIILNGMLLEEINMINDPFNNEKNSIPEYIEKIIQQINQYIINKINDCFTKYKAIIIATGELIILNNSITGDAITKIFKDLNCESDIQSIDICTFINEIKQIVKVN